MNAVLIVHINFSNSQNFTLLSLAYHKIISLKKNSPYMYM